MQQGSLFWQEGRYEDARRATQESLAFFASQQKTTPVTRSTRTTRIQRTLEGDPVDLGVAHRLLGALADAEGRAAEALDHLNAALFIFEQADHKRRIAHVAHDLSYVYIKKGAFEQAHASLRRALNLAERLGDDPLIAVVYSNQGELAAAGGDLEEAETWYLRSLALAEQFNDREYISRWNTRLAAVLRAQDRLDEAATCTLRALSLGRAMRNNPCTGSALVALSNLRIAQARATRNLPIVTKRLLTHAGQNARRALALPGLEAETHVQANLALAHIALLLGDHHAPDQLAQVIEQAHLYELTLVETQARYLAETP
jgi:tetratricopeptide (TPR) repeat protein